MFNYMNLIITTHPLKYSVEKLIKNLSVVRGDYGKISDGQIEKISNNNELRKMKKIDIKTLIKLVRNAYIQENILMSYKNLVNMLPKFASAFKNGTSIMDLAKKHDFAPLMVSRQLLKYNGYDKQSIKKMLKHPDLITDKRLREDVIFIKENRLDMFTQTNKTESEKNALEFEYKIGKFLTSKSVKFKTQEELAKEQIAKYGKAINTPDFLIISDFSINNKPIKWIDAKNFYGAKSWFIKLSIEKQVKKYIKEWGNGAIVFSQGFSEKLEINNHSMLIDYASLINIE
jgi:hypothetical protein